MSWGFPPRSETNQDVQAREIARGLNVRMGFVAITAPVFALYAKAAFVSKEAGQYPMNRVNSSTNPFENI